MKVIVTGIIPEEVMNQIKKEHEVEANPEDGPMAREKLLRAIGDKEGLLCMITDIIDTAMLERAPRLKMIANFGVGFNNIDLKAATKRSILVSNTPGVLTDATADTTFALILATARRVVEGDKKTRGGEFRFWAPFHFLGQQVTGKTLGIIGMGRIGKAVAKRAHGFDMNILYYDSCRLEALEEKSLGATFINLDTLISTSDFISLHVPLIPETYHLINKQSINTEVKDVTPFVNSHCIRFRPRYINTGI